MPARAPVALCLLVLAAGCTPAPNTVSGTVTLDGKPLDGGYISFHPTGAGAARGSEVHGGAYKVTDLPPGKWKVSVTSQPKLVVEKSGKASVPRALPPANPIPKSAKGNHQVVEVGPGEQTLNFELTR